MKKIFTLLFIAVAMGIISCGPSAEETAKTEAEAKAKMDSIFTAASLSASVALDSVVAVTPEPTEKAAEEKH